MRTENRPKCIGICLGLLLGAAIPGTLVPQGWAQSGAPESSQTTPSDQTLPQETTAATPPQETAATPQKTTTTPQEIAPAPTSVGALRPDEIPARMQALSERLETLRKANLPKEELERVEAEFSRVLSMLADLEQAVKRREGYLTSTAEIPERLEEISRQQQIEEKVLPVEFDQYTDELQSEFSNRLKELQEEIDRLVKELSQGDIRVARIADEIGELEARSAELGAELQSLGYGATQAQATTDPNAPLPETQEIALERQLVRSQIAALEAEREWLTKRRPLQDRLLGLARLRAANVERDLDVISAGLQATISSQRRKLRAELADVESRMSESDSRAETLLLAIRRRTIEIEMETLAYFEESKNVGSKLLEQEKLTARMNQDKDRLIALMEKYGAGEWVAQRVMVDLETFRREGERELETAVSEAQLEERLRTVNKHLFEIGTELFEADERGEDIQRELARMPLEVPPAGRRALRSEARQLMDEQKQALQKQEQVLTETAQALTKLIELHRQQENLVDSLYSFVLTRILWLRNREPLGLYPPNFGLVKIAADAGLSAARRAYVYVRTANVERLRREFRASPLPHVAFGVLFILLPIVAVIVRRRGKAKLASMLGRSAASDKTPGVGSLLLLVLITAIWPGYIFLFLWVRSWFVADLDLVVPALQFGLQLAAVVLWILLFGLRFFKDQGWAMQNWRLTPEACRLFRWTLRIACAAAFLFMVPRYALLSAPELGGTVEGSLALARLLMIGFQLVLLFLLGALLRRNSSFTHWLLGRSHDEHGLLWQIWPILHLLALIFLAGIVGLNLTGYQYAATFFWERSVISLGIVIAFWAVFAAARGIVATFVNRQAARAGASGASERAIKLLNASLGVPLFLVAVGAIAEAWGFSVLDFMATPLGTTLLWRGLFIAVAVVAAVVVIQISNAVVMSLLRPRILSEGRTREAGRKLQTIGPLTQTIVKVAVILIAFLVILEQVGVATGPILAGVGIFGLAIGFAAQSLIKDVINGLFILFEGSLGVGDIVSIGGTAGQVEKVTLRSVRVRDLAGNVHFIPNSTVERVENMTKDFSRYLMDVGVAYREDTDEVVSVMKEVDAEMRNDPLFKWDILEPIEILGVDRFADSAVVVRARLTTRPMQQWRTGREFNRRLKKAFDQRGIEIPFPHRTVYWGQTKEGQRPLQIDIESQRMEGPYDAARALPEEPGAPNAETEARKAEDKKTGT